MKTALFSGMFKPQPIETAIEKAAEVGYDAIEIMVGFEGDHLDVGCTPERADEIHGVARDNGIDICLIYASMGREILTDPQKARGDLDDVNRFLDIGDRMSCKMLKVTAGRLKDNAFKDDEARVVADWLAEACDRAAAHDSRIVAEIHFGQYCETVAMGRKIIDLVDRPNFGVIHDAGNLHITGDIYGEDSVDVLGDRIFHVHVKDMVATSADDQAGHDYLVGRFKRSPLNAGDVDHTSLLRGLKKIGFDGYLSCEASGGDDPVAVAKHELAELKGLMDQAGV